MKRQVKILALLLAVGGLIFLNACKKSKDDPQAPTIATAATADGIDLNGATAGTGVAAGTSLIVTFSTNIDQSTATSDNITLTRTLDDVTVPLTIVTVGPIVTITPDELLVGGLAYELAITTGLKASNGLAFAGTTRDFTIAGTYAPIGPLAYYSFESTANSETGAYSPASANNVVDISYVDSRNAAAGKAAHFNGTTSIIEIPNGASLTNTADFAISFWVKPDTATHHGGNFLLGFNGFRGFQIEMNKNDCKMAASYDIDGLGKDQDLWLDGTGNVGFSGWTFSKDLRPPGFAAIVDQKWTHLVFTYTSSTHVGAIYLNGELVKTQDWDSYPSDSPFFNAGDMKLQEGDGNGTNLALGFFCDRETTAFDFADYSNPDHNHFSGDLDDLRIYHKIITENDVKLMYASEK